MPANVATRLMQHYVDKCRRLPWRVAPGGPPQDPYRVWLSEVMLQQTSVAAVAPRFERFVARWPSIDALAAAPEAVVLSEWAGLGYYARARNLVACAREIAHRGGFPRNAAGLRKLPGIGDYTAAAIAAIAFGERIVPVDTNVERVVARLNAIERPKRGVIASLGLDMLGDAPGDFAQALMDLGATICRPRAPDCPACPLQADCAAFASGEPDRFPARKLRRERPNRYGIAQWIERDGHFWLVRRPARGLLGSMAALPGGHWTDRPIGNTARYIGTVRHVFTHFTLDLIVEAGEQPVGEGWWQPLERLAQAGLPTLYRRAAELGMSRKERPRAAA